MRDKKPQGKKKRKLEVRKQTIRELSDQELKQAAGGYIRPTQTGHCYTAS